MKTKTTTLTVAELVRLIVAARKEAQRAWERGDAAMVVHFEALITRYNTMWPEVSR